MRAHGLHPTDRNRSRRAAAVGCVALLAYASIKGAWGLGSTVGVVDPDTWESDLAALERWQWFAALWGTVLVDLAATASLVTLAQPPSTRRVALRRHLRRLAGLGAVVVGIVGLGGLAATLASSTGLVPRGSDPLSAWVFIVVYGSFAVVAASFAVVIAEDRRRESAAP